MTEGLCGPLSGVAFHVPFHLTLGSLSKLSLFFAIYTRLTWGAPPPTTTKTTPTPKKEVEVLKKEGGGKSWRTDV